MSDFIPILPRARRLEIILRVKAKMVAEREARGDKVAAQRMAEFYDGIYATVRDAGRTSGGNAWAVAGLAELEAAQAAPQPAARTSSMEVHAQLEFEREQRQDAAQAGLETDDPDNTETEERWF